MLMDEKMDHGPILVQHKYTGTIPVAGTVLDEVLAKEGGQMLTVVIPKWIQGDIEPQPQTHDDATICGKIEKQDAELSIDPQRLPTGTDAYDMLLKIHAYEGWPGAFFFHNGKRIKITSACIENDMLVLKRVVPEGKKEMTYDAFLTSITG
jgi:methionyl-tRNA formyltransferase